MEYYLMHKDIVVALLKISNEGKVTLNRKNEDAINHFPIGGQMNNSKFADWWRNRAIPENREGIENALKKYGHQTIGNALVDSFALSLTDCYWIKPRESKLKWDQVNLYKNDFVDTIGELEFNPSFKIKKNKSGVATSSGELKKKWYISKDKKRMLIKGNVGNSFQQSLNEVFISKIHETLNPKYCLKYDLVRIDIGNNRKIIGCQSQNFCNENTEFISAWELIQSEKKRGSDNEFSLLKRVCLKLGINESHFYEYMDYLILTDYLFTNIDRHLNNFGVLRNPDTLKIIGFSPIYDSGNSMFYNIPLNELHKVDLKNIKINSFFSKESKMLSLIKNKHCLNLKKIKLDLSIYKNDIEENRERYIVIERLLKRKLEMLIAFQKK